MKPLRIFAFLILILFNFACSEEETETSFTGKWYLTEYLADPGDGSGKWTKAQDKRYMILNADGTISGNAFAVNSTYRIIDEKQVEFTSGNNIRIYFYKFGPGSLELMGGCIEACGSRYKR